MPHTQIAITIRIPRVSTIRILDPVSTRKLANAGWLPKRGAGQLWCIHEGGTKIAEIAVEPVWGSEQKAEGAERIGCSAGLLENLGEATKVCTVDAVPWL